MGIDVNGALRLTDRLPSHYALLRWYADVTTASTRHYLVDSGRPT